MVSEYGYVYDHFKSNPLHLTHDDLVTVAEAFHHGLAFGESEQKEEIRELQSKIDNMTAKLTHLSTIIETTRGLINVVQNADKPHIKHFVENSNKFRSLATIEALERVQMRLLEAQAHKAAIESHIEQAQRRLNALEATRVHNAVNGYYTINSLSRLLDKAPIKFEDHKLADSWETFSSRYAHYFPVGLTGALANMIGFTAAHLETETSDRRQLLKSNTDASAHLREVLSYLNTQNDRSLDLDKLSHMLYNVVQKEGTLGSVYVRTVDTLKCLLLKVGCPKAYNSTAELMTGLDAPAFVVSTVLPENHENKTVLVEPLVANLSVSEMIDSLTRANIRPSFLVNGKLSLENYKNHSEVNPFQGFDPIIIERESNVVTLPPVSDISSGLLKLSPLMNEELRPSIMMSSNSVVGYIEPLEETPVIRQQGQSVSSQAKTQPQ